MNPYILGAVDIAKIIQDIAYSLAGDKKTNETLDSLAQLSEDLVCVLVGGYGRDLWVQRNLDWIIKEGHYESFD